MTPTNLPIAENLNPYDSASLIRSQGTSGELVDNPINYRAPVQGPVQSLSQVPQTTTTPQATTPTPAPNVASELERIKNEALAVQGKLNAMNEPTIGETLRTPGFETGPTYEELYGSKEQRAKEDREAQRNIMRMFQQEINATNKVYDEMLNRERLAGTGRLGTQRAAAARGGLIGSDFGMAQEAAVTSDNQRAQNAIQAERQAKVGAIMGTVRKAVLDDKTERRLSRQQDAESRIKWLTSASERKAKNKDIAATAFLTQNIDPTTLSPDELQAIATESGLTTNDLINEYLIKKGEMEAAASESELKTAKTQAEIDKINADIAKGKLITIGEGTTLYNTETKETWKNPKTYAPGTGSGSSLGLTADDKRTLLGGGYSEGDIAILEDGVRSQGLQSIIEAERQAGATDSQIRALEKAYGAEESQAPSKIDRKFISDWYGIPDNDEGGNSFLGFEWGQTNSEQLDNLMSTIERYKAVGMSDEDIYKELDQ